MTTTESTDTPTGHLIGYARVSTGHQDAQFQRDALSAAGCTRIFEDQASGKSTDGRPELAAALDYLRPGDVLVVWKLDRLARSVVDLIKIVEDLGKRGVGFKILTGALAGIDTTRPEGRLFMTIAAGFAAFERELTHERVMAGLEAARNQGRTGGRPAALSPDQVAAVHARHDKGESPTKIAQAMGVHRATVYRVLAKD
ncbi:MAG TPA: recombinase family protein [Actinocrinis sp.]|jgi:DNA invertase Pin-like site-specific DNA recombinase|uniref:recombinase family protein n=1 Tax=Actinocrinis sp. TaxID=1920516 RepID=UPI002DDD9799|nr:recombinase family protein [Actinocrinis sp.]HEV3170762.1 recombinase family protein [Actinocrinis sp.]